MTSGSLSLAKLLVQRGGEHVAGVLAFDFNAGAGFKQLFGCGREACLFRPESNCIVVIVMTRMAAVPVVGSRPGWLSRGG